MWSRPIVYVGEHMLTVGQQHPCYAPCCSACQPVFLALLCMISSLVAPELSQHMTLASLRKLHSVLHTNSGLSTMNVTAQAAAFEAPYVRECLPSHRDCIECIHD